MTVTQLRSESLAAELRLAAADSPDRPFLRMVHGEWTYRQLDEETDRVAAGLRRLGVRQGDVVSLMLPNCVEFVVVWFALGKLGAVTAPVNTSFGGQVLANAIDLVRSRLLIAHASLRDQWAEARPGLATVEQVIVVGDTTAEPSVQPYECLRTSVVLTGAAVQTPIITSADLCLLLYTSGTTGRSKAAMISHRFVLAQAAGVVEGLGLREDDVLYCPYPLFHLDAAVMTVAPALLLRGVAAIGVRFSVSQYWNEMRTLRATVFDFMGATLTCGCGRSCRSIAFPSGSLSARGRTTPHGRLPVPTTDGFQAASLDAHWQNCDRLVARRSGPTRN